MLLQVISFAPPGGGLLIQAEVPTKKGAAKGGPAPAAASNDDDERRLGYSRQVERLRTDILVLKQEIEVERQR